MKLLWVILIGALVGWIANTILKKGEKGFLRTLLLGVAGSVSGGLLFRILGFGKPGNILGSVFSGVLGAILLLWLIEKIRKD